MRIPAEETPGPQPDGASRVSKLLAATAPILTEGQAAAGMSGLGWGRDARPPALSATDAPGRRFSARLAQSASKPPHKMVGAAGIEPATPTMST